MIYSMLTKIWKYSLIFGVNWLANPLTRLLNNYWLKTYSILEHTAIPYGHARMFKFTFDLSKLGDCTPQLLGSLCYTILIHPKVAGFKGNKAIILTPHYLDGDRWLT